MALAFGISRHAVVGGPYSSGGIVKLSAPQRVGAIGATNEQQPAILQLRGRVLLAVDGERSAIGKTAGSGEQH